MEGEAVGDVEASRVAEGVPEPVAESPVVAKAKRCDVNMPEQVVRKRSMMSSQYVISPFTAEVKRQTFVDGTYPNLFWAVDNVKWKAFESEWRRIIPR